MVKNNLNCTKSKNVHRFPEFLWYSVFQKSYGVHENWVWVCVFLCECVAVS